MLLQILMEERTVEREGMEENAGKKVSLDF